MSDVRIAVAGPEHQGEALGVVFGQQMTPEQQAQQILEVTRAADADQALEGLLAAWRGDRLVGAVWGQIQPGCSAAVWPPRLQSGEPAETGDALLGELLNELTSRGLKIAQSLLRPQDHEDFNRFTAAGFRHMADLRYLVSLPQQWPTSEPATSLRYEPSCEANLDRLKRVIDRTFVQTLDCPGLSDIRSTDDLLTEYRAIGRFDPSLWLIVREGDSDIGCLLLANHPEVPQWELVYVGIASEARGRGFGLEIVRRAQWLARGSGCSRILLAVDIRNDPAIRIYESAGFTAWEHRSALLKVLGPGGISGASQKAN